MIVPVLARVGVGHGAEIDLGGDVLARERRPQVLADELGVQRRRPETRRIPGRVVGLVLVVDRLDLDPLLAVLLHELGEVEGQRLQVLGVVLHVAAVERAVVLHPGGGDQGLAHRRMFALIASAALMYGIRRCRSRAIEKFAIVKSLAVSFSV